MLPPPPPTALIAYPSLLKFGPRVCILFSAEKLIFSKIHVSRDNFSHPNFVPALISCNKVVFRLSYCLEGRVMTWLQVYYTANLWTFLFNLLNRASIYHSKTTDTQILKCKRFDTVVCFNCTSYKIFDTSFKSIIELGWANCTLLFQWYGDILSNGTVTSFPMVRWHPFQWYGDIFSNGTVTSFPMVRWHLFQWYGDILSNGTVTSFPMVRWHIFQWYGDSFSNGTVTSFPMVRWHLLTIWDKIVFLFYCFPNDIIIKFRFFCRCLK